MAVDPKTTIWIRLEPLTRSAENLGRTLGAPLHDPLWMLARQWQTGEFAGEDGAAPATVELRYHISRLHLGSDPTAEGTLLDDGVAEATALGEVQRLSWGDRARLGQELTCIVSASLGTPWVDPILDALLVLYPLHADPALTELPGERRAASLLDGDTLDGVAAWTGLSARQYPSRPAAIHPMNWAGFLVAIVRWVTSVRARYGDLSATAPRPTGWSPSFPGYSLTLSAAHPGGGTVRLKATPARSGGLDWMNLDVQGEALGSLPTSGHSTIQVLPSRVKVRGMPAPRWWDFEDSARSLLAIDAEDHDLARLMWLEFLLVGSHDWFVAPLSVPRGSLVWVAGVEVTDVFGVKTLVQAADQDARPPVDDLPLRGTQRWSLFRPSCAPSLHSGGHVDDVDDRVFQNAPLLADFLVVPPGVGPLSLVGPRLEELRLLRDEDANLVWAVEHTVQDRWGRPVSGRDFGAHQAGTGDDAPLPAVTAPGASGALRYRVRTPVPPHWTPFVAQRLTGEQIRLRRAELWSQSGAPRTSRGRLLDEIGPSGELNEEAVPRAGLRVARELRRARAADGSTVTWVQRVVESGPGEGSSGLRFDLALPDDNANTDERS